MSAAWLAREVQAQPRRFPLLRAAEALPQAPMSGPRSLALAAHEMIEAGADGVRTAVLGLAGPSSPLPAGLAQELARLPADSAAAGLVGAVEERLLGLLVRIGRRRPADDPAAQRDRLDRLAGPCAEGEHGFAGRLCDGRTADALAHRLAVVAGCTVRVIAATGGALPSGPGTGNALGGHGLGDGLVVGEAVAAAEFGCRVVLGPVEAAHAGRLRPGGADHELLRAALARGLPPCLTCRVELLVRGTPGSGLGAATLGSDARLDGQPPAVEGELLLTA